MKIPFKYVVIFGVLLILIIVFIFTRRSTDLKKETPPITPDQTSLEQEIPVIGELTTPADFQETISVNGVLKARYRTMISSEAGGRVQEWKADIGEYVEKGEVILSLDDEIAKLTFDQAKANFEAAKISAEKQKSDYDRFKQLHDQGDLSKNELESAYLGKLSAEAGLAAAEAQFGMSARNLKETKVKMPFNGRISSQLVELGQSLAPGTPVAEIVQINPIKLHIGVPEDAIIRIEEGQTVLVKTESRGGLNFEGTVYAVGIAADMATRLFPVEIHIENKDLKLIPGMAATARIVLDKFENEVVLPRNAVVTIDDKTHVFKIRGDRANRSEITIKAKNDERILIESGVQIGDTLVTIGKESLKDGQKVSLELKTD